MTTNKERAVEVMRNFWHDGRYAVGFDEIADGLADAGLLTPDPKPRTLADMTHEERKACQWMQADFDHGFADHPLRVVIGKCHGGTVDIILSGGGVSCVYPDKLTPLPDLPRMVWPDDQATEEASDLPQPEYVKPDPQPGEAWLIEYEGKRYEAVYWYSPLYAHWSFVANREVLNSVESPEATPVSRLVPEKEQA